MMLGSVLVVENTVLYAKRACQMLRDRGCEAYAVPDADLMDDAATTIEGGFDRIDGHYDVIMSAVQESLSQHHFDVIVINLHLEPEKKDSFDDGDYRGLDILEYVTVNHPGIACIIFTGNPPYVTKSLYENYNVANIAHKKVLPSGDIPEKVIVELCNAVVKILVEGHSIRKLIDGRPYRFEGVSSRIYRTLHNSGVMKQVLAGVNQGDDLIVRTLGGGLGEPVVRATSLMANIWNVESGLPAYPFIDRLGRMEFGGAFWKEHRDHLVHQLLVYFLGLYLFQGSKVIQKVLSDYLDEQGLKLQDFYFIWKAISLFHDLGYVFEVEYPKRGPLYEQMFEELNDRRSRSLYHYLIARNVEILEAQDEEIRRDAGISYQSIDKNNFFSSLPRFEREDLFDTLQKQAKKTRLGKVDSSLKDYWEFALRPSEGSVRSNYCDHGIAGALLMLQLQRTLEDSACKVRSVLEQNPDIWEDKEIPSLIADLHSEIERHRSAVEIAACAIALHNINIEEWDHDAAFRFKHLTLNRYHLSFLDTPFAFLLALVDNIQSWDRQKYEFPEEDELPMQSQDIDFRFREDGRLFIDYKKDPLRGTPESLFKKTIEKMAKYLNRGDLESLLVEVP